MDIRTLTDSYAVSPQIVPSDVASIAAAGFRTLICNRPDTEIPDELHAAQIRVAAEAAGMTFVDNPVQGSALTADAIEAQRRAVAEADGPALAYCNSGTRSTVVWMFANAGSVPVDDLVSAAKNAGYELSGLVPQLHAFADTNR